MSAHTFNIDDVYSNFYIIYALCVCEYEFRSRVGMQIHLKRKLVILTLNPLSSSMNTKYMHGFMWLYKCHNFPPENPNYIV